MTTNSPIDRQIVASSSNESILNNEVTSNSKVNSSRETNSSNEVNLDDKEKRFVSPSDIDYDRFLNNVKLAMSDNQEWIIPPIESNVGQLLNSSKCKVNKEVTGLVLIMIVKNESEIIRRCLDSTKGIVDAICITDTNSDRPGENSKIEKYCPDIIREWARENNIPCEVPVHNFTGETFQFDFARTLSFINGCKYFPNAKYFITIDADMELVKTGDFEVKNLTADAYKIYQQTSNSRYQNLRIMKNHTISRVRGATHEYWQVQKIIDGKVEDCHQELLHDLEIKDNDDGRCKGDKYIRDKYLMERDFLRKSTTVDLRTRYLFYLAQTYMCLNKNDWAIDMYNQRFLAGGWVEERWYSLFQIGQIKVRKYNELIHNWKSLEWALAKQKELKEKKEEREKKEEKLKEIINEIINEISSLNNLEAASHIFKLYEEMKKSQKEVLRAMLTAYKFRPTRAEPLYYLAKMYREEGNNEMCIYYAMKAQKVGYPIDDSLFVDIRVYNYLILFEISICAYYVEGRYQMGVDAHRKLKLMYDKLPDYIQQVIDRNDIFYKC